MSERHSAEYLAHIASDAWKVLSLRVRERAGHRCQLCNSTKKLEAHHRTYSSMGKEYEEQDLIALCEACHEAFHERRGRKPKKRRKGRYVLPEMPKKGKWAARVNGKWLPGRKALKPAPK